jgi:alkylation response protein AidB-like acyl-CoA dehydrogenase
MSVDFHIAVGEIGAEASAGIDEWLTRAFSGRPVVDYAYGTPPAWEVVAEGGWDTVGVAEQDGGAGMELRDLIAFAKVVGRWLPPLPLLETIMAKRWSEAARKADGPVTIGVVSESGRILVPFGETPGILQLAGTGSGDLGVQAPAPGAADDFAPSLRLAEGGEASSLTPEEARELAVVWGAEAVGCAERMLDVAVDYVKERHQFGQPVGRFQAVKHHLANALISVQEAESAVIWGAADAPRLTAALEVAFDAALRTAEIAVQVHGGMGFTWELGLHVYLRQIVTLRQLALPLAALADGG